MIRYDLAMYHTPIYAYIVGVIPARTSKSKFSVATQPAFVPARRAREMKRPSRGWCVARGLYDQMVSFYFKFVARKNRASLFLFFLFFVSILVALGV